MDELAALSLLDKVTFATLNVFGRNLNSISKTESRAGRDHYGNHSVMMMTGKNIKPARDRWITGTALQASAIDSATGRRRRAGTSRRRRRTWRRRRGVQQLGKVRGHAGSLRRN